MSKFEVKNVEGKQVAEAELAVDVYGIEKPSTKAAVAMLKALGLEGKRLTIIVREDDINAYLSFRNINNGALIMPADVAAHFGEVLA